MVLVVQILDAIIQDRNAQQGMVEHEISLAAASEHSGMPER